MSWPINLNDCDPRDDSVDERPAFICYTLPELLNLNQGFINDLRDLPVKIFIARSWSELIELSRHKPIGISINAKHFEGHSFVEVLNMVETVFMLMGCDEHMTIALGLNANTPYSLIKEAQKSNVLGFIPNTIDFDQQETLNSIKAIIAGIPYWPKKIIDRLPGAKKKRNVSTHKVTLTPRQQQIFDLVTTKGCSNKHIAKIMSLSESTVKLHMSHIFKKYGVKNRTQLAVFSKQTH